MGFFQKLSVLLLFQGVTVGYSQALYQGIVADSVTLNVLSGVHVRIKNSARGVVTTYQGRFSVEAVPFDTLIFTFIGYKSLELPLLFEEHALLVRLHENINLLKEITISAKPLSGNEIMRSQRVLPKPMSAGEGVFSPIDYFSKWQQEKRKLLKLIQENDRTLTYLQVVSDQEIREELMEKFFLTEAQYFDLLVKFNQQSGAVQYATDFDVIYAALKRFLEKSLH
jgi:hypothetical protein